MYQTRFVFHAARSPKFRRVKARGDLKLRGITKRTLLNLKNNPKIEVLKLNYLKSNSFVKYCKFSAINIADIIH